MFRGYIVMASCFCMTMSFGILYSYGVFFVPLQDQFGWSTVANSTIPAVGLITFSVGAMGGGFLAERLGNRRIAIMGALLAGSGTVLSGTINQFPQLLVLFGVFASLGSSFVVIVATSLIVKWFVRNRGLAVGVMTAGSGLGTIVVPPIAATLIIKFGWRNTFFMIGSAYFALLLLASYFMQTPEERSLRPLESEDMLHAHREKMANFDVRQALASQSFWLIYVMFFLGSLVATMFLIHAPNLVASKGMSKLLGAEAIGAFGAGSLVARVAVGHVSDRIERSRSVVIAFFSEFLGILALPFAVQLPIPFLLSSFAIGFGYGGFLSDFIALTGDLFGSRSMGSLWGIIETAYGIGGLLGPIIAGAYFQRFQSYTGIFEFAALVAAVALATSLVFSRRVEPIISRQIV